MSAGLERENTVLVVSKNADEWNKILWEHVCQIMGEGTHGHIDERVNRVGLTILRPLINLMHASTSDVYNTCSQIVSWHLVQLFSSGLSPGLFSSSELLVMGSKVQVNRLKKTVESSYQEFAASVRKRLHIFVVWDTQFGSPFTKERRWHSKMITEDSLYQEECERVVFALVCKFCTHIDYYHPWSKQSYGDVALRVWQDSTCPRWDEWTSSPSQLEALSLLAAHMHLTTMECLYCSVSSRASELISPGTFLECLNMTKKLAVKLIMEQKV